MENYNYKISKIIGNIAKTAFFRNIFFTSLIISIILPLYGIFFVIPTFTAQLIKNVEENASRTGTHLSLRLFSDNGIKAKYFESDEIAKEIEVVKNDFKLEKIKVFSNSGKVIYSTANEDIGKQNNHEYFHDVVAKGKIYSKIIEKNTQTLEHNFIDVDVAEVYIPVMQSNAFTGAFEIYYDITEQKRDLDVLLFRFSITAIVTSLVLLTLVIIMLIKASKMDIYRKEVGNVLNLYNENLEERVEKQTQEIELTQETSLEALSILAEYYDMETGAHLDRIQSYVYLLLNYLKERPPFSEHLQTNRKYIKEITLASVLHDVGKTAIPTEILTKPGKLNDVEFSIMKKHTEIAGNILDNANRAFINHFKKDSYLALARDIALYHHERWDGKGYPKGLKGKSIPLAARVVSIVDVYDALRSKRPYKEPLSHEEAVKEIIESKGKSFDPLIVEAFLAKAAQFEMISSENLGIPESKYFDTSVLDVRDEGLGECS